MNENSNKKWGSRVTGWLRVTGEDAATYLQSQFSNDLSGAQVSTATYGLFLSLKGKVRADAFICQTATDVFNVVSYQCTSSDLRALLEENVIADEVEFFVQEVGSSFVLATDAMPQVSAGGLAFPGRRMRAPHFDVLLPAGHAMEPDHSEELERLRILAGIPSVPLDLGPGDLPQEAGVEPAAVSFNKGCYLGQEVMARLKAMGRVQRRLFGVSGGGAPPDSQTQVRCADQIAGEVRSIVQNDAGGWVGIAMLRRKFLETTQSGSWTLESGGMMEVGEVLDDG